MDPRFKGKLGYAVAADAWGQLEKAAVGNVTEQVFYAQSCFPRVPCYRLYNEVLLFICATLFLQLPMEVLRDHNIEEDRLDDHQEDKYWNRLFKMNTFPKQVNTFFQSPCHKKCAKKSALEQLFEDEDRELLQATTSKSLQS